MSLMNSRFLGEVCSLSYPTLQVAAGKLFFLASMEKSPLVFHNFHMLFKYPTSTFPSNCWEGIKSQGPEFFNIDVYLYFLCDLCQGVSPGLTQRQHIAQDHSWDSLAIYTLNTSWIKSWPDTYHIILRTCSFRALSSVQHIPCCHTLLRAPKQWYHGMCM